MSDRLRHYTSAERKAAPVHTGVMLYFPDSLMAIARLSKKANDKHNPGEPVHWARGKSTDQTDCTARHMLTPDAVDPETGELELVAAVWRLMAELQLREEKRLVAAGIMPLSGVVPVEPDSSPVPRHGAAGIRSGLGRLPCGCKAYEGGTMLPQRDPGDECEGPTCTCGARRTVQHNLGCPMRDWRPHYSEQEDLSPDARYGS